MTLSARSGESDSASDKVGEKLVRLHACDPEVEVYGINGGVVVDAMDAESI